MTAQLIMDPSPTVLKTSDKIKTAVAYIMENRFRSLPVVDEQGRYMGIFGVNCLLRLVLPKAVMMEDGLDNVGFIQDSLHDLHERLREVEDQTVSMCMHSDIATVTPNTPLVETLLLLYRTRISIPVIEPGSGKLVGMISYFDVGERILAA
ncbi:MAG: CBS domain-containing protein [Chromatiales bacterium]|jgi:CBS-domain-containing membrane protein